MIVDKILPQVEELVARVVAAARDGSGVRDQLRRGCLAYMEACADPTVARILADAPAVLGVAACRALDAASCVPASCAPASVVPASTGTQPPCSTRVSATSAVRPRPSDSTTDGVSAPGLWMAASAVRYSTKRERGPFGAAASTCASSD